MVDRLACKLKPGKSNLPKKISLILVATYKNKSHFLSTNIYFFDELDLALAIVLLRLIEGYVAVSLKPLISMLGEVIQNVDSRRHFRRMGDYFYGIEKNWLEERYRQLLRVVAESLRLPGTVSRKQVRGWSRAALARTRLDLEPGLHNKYYGSG